ncbi:MAG: type I methionyl aminopeptidase, partial [Propionibacteriaceae bacterium]|nr:type I methionyl aminopeptidase [Propionibacteriaceae bacterium]
MSRIKPYPVSPIRAVPARIARPPYVGESGPEVYTGPDVQTADVIERMREAGRIAAQALAEAARHVAPGVP